MLSFLIFFPVLAALIVALIPTDRASRLAALVFSGIQFFVSLLLLKDYDSSSAALQFVEVYKWIPSFGIQYFLGLDGISLWLVLLTTFLTPLTILASWNSISEKVKSFHVCMLLLEMSMIGALVSMDLVLFYVFWELMLIPMYLLVGVWGGEKRIYAAVKFFIYTMVGSVLMLLAIIGLMYYGKEQTGILSASLLDLYKVNLPFDLATFFNPQMLMFAAFALAFAIKVPLFPLHTWLPDAHVQAPTPGSVILAGVLLKMGTYGFLRFALPLFPEATLQAAPIFVGISIFGIIYGAWVAMIQPDMKKLVAYSSVSHLGYVVLGLFAFNIEGISGGLYQMLNHGVSTGALFLLVGMIYERTHSREISKYGGLAAVMPVFAVFFLIITLSSIAVPGTNGFVGEFLILLGAYKSAPWTSYIAVTGVVWGAAYMLWMYKKVFFGPAGELVPEVEDAHHDHGPNHKVEHHGAHKHPLVDLSLREICVLIPLVVLVFWMGIFPNQFLEKSKASIEHFVKNKSQYELTIYRAQTSDIAVRGDLNP
ncbi:MAG: NADH-quinone oxidoreductase subunit M [Oligoflexia bacterium]|nr:NADH-quinone oxidoreductase subunit M [Oligoflexia bacterium]